MKALRSQPMIAFAASLIAGYLKLCFLTLRWRREGMEIAQGVWDQEGGAIVCVWHQGVPMGPLAWPKGEARQELRILISKSADGEFITQTMARLGHGSVRGSSAKKSKAGSKNKAGELAFREMVAWVKSGGAIAVTPDGPRGPARVMAPGVLALARMTGAPVLLAGLACKPCIRLKTWDRTIIPLPFARAALTYAGPVHAGRDDDLEALALDWALRLTTVTERAEALAAD
ncbi:MAG: hypothetical protein JWM33_1102 [Caulobacteraceae bacterium]|nr:hypothetical protein [Caulobacteraceae bacterium]